MGTFNLRLLACLLVVVFMKTIILVPGTVVIGWTFPDFLGESYWLHFKGPRRPRKITSKLATFLCQTDNMKTQWCVADTTVFNVRTTPKQASERNHFILFSESNSSLESTSMVSDFKLNKFCKWKHQLDATILSILFYLILLSTCFGCYTHPSSGASNMYNQVWYNLITV